MHALWQMTADRYTEDVSSLCCAERVVLLAWCLGRLFLLEGKKSHCKSIQIYSYSPCDERFSIPVEVVSYRTTIFTTTRHEDLLKGCADNHLLRRPPSPDPNLTEQYCTCRLWSECWTIHTTNTIKTSVEEMSFGGHGHFSSTVPETCRIYVEVH